MNKNMNEGRRFSYTPTILITYLVVSVITHFNHQGVKPYHYDKVTVKEFASR